MKTLATILLLVTTSLGSAWAQDTAPAAAEAKKPFVTTTGYPLDTCIVSDEELDDSAKTFTVDGNTFMTCCKKCQAKVEKDPATYAAKKEAAIVKAQAANYPLEVCAVSGKPLGSMGEPISLVVDNTLIKLCCKGCVKKATANKTDITAKIQTAAFAKQSANYATKTCPVSKHELDADAVSVMHGDTLVKLCCEDCMAKFKATPNAFVAKVTEATKAKGAEAAGHEGHGKEGKKGDEPSAPGGCCCSAAPGAAKPATSECCETGAKAEGKKDTGCCEAGAKPEAAKPEAKKPDAAPAKKVN